MADIIKLYIELILDYDPYTDISDHSSLTGSQMLYNLKMLLDDFKCLMDFSDYTDNSINLYNRCNTLINIFESLGFKPDYR